LASGSIGDLLQQGQLEFFHLLLGALGHEAGLDVRPPGFSQPGFAKREGVEGDEVGLIRKRSYCGPDHIAEREEDWFGSVDLKQKFGNAEGISVAV
jgi:hypothetical protein